MNKRVFSTMLIMSIIISSVPVIGAEGGKNNQNRFQYREELSYSEQPFTPAVQQQEGDREQIQSRERIQEMLKDGSCQDPLCEYLGICICAPIGDELKLRLTKLQRERLYEYLDNPELIFESDLVKDMIRLSDQVRLQDHSCLSTQ